MAEMQRDSLELVRKVVVFVCAASTGVRLTLPRGVRMMGPSLSVRAGEQSELGWVVQGLQLDENPASVRLYIELLSGYMVGRLRLSTWVDVLTTRTH